MQKLGSAILAEVTGLTKEQAAEIASKLDAMGIRFKTRRRERGQTTAAEDLCGKYVAEGYDNKEIAILTGITEATVKVHLRSLFVKLGFNNRTQYAVWRKTGVLPESCTAPKTDAA